MVYFTCYSLDYTQYFFGGAKNEQTRDFEWSNGKAIELDMWYGINPSGDGPCISLFPGSGLNDLGCNHKYRIVCN